MTSLNEQLEMFEKQIGDLSSYVDVLKETVNTKDQHTASLYAESEEIRSRLKVSFTLKLHAKIDRLHTKEGRKTL